MAEPASELELDLIPDQYPKANLTPYVNYNYTWNNPPLVPHPPSVENERVQDIIYLTLYSATFIIAVFGNSIVCKVVFTKASMRNFTNLLLANMAISDILCALMFPLWLLLCWDKFILIAGNYACISAKTIQLLSFQVSSITMTVVAIDRFLLVYFPLVRKHRLIPVYWVMLLVWVVSMVIIAGTSPSLAYHRYFISGEAYIKCEVALVFSDHALNAREQRIRLVVANLAHFWIPLGVISVCYGSITWKVMKRNVGSMTTTQQEILLRTKWKTIKMLIAAVAVFFLCWFPFFIFNLLDFFGNPGRKRPCNKTGVFFVAVWLAFTSCCYNPFVYWVYSRDFRGGLKDVWNSMEGFARTCSAGCGCCQAIADHRLSMSSEGNTRSSQKRPSTCTRMSNLSGHVNLECVGDNNI